MIINVAGAGGGKTTILKNKILEQYNITQEGNIYCLAYTNSAANHIKSSVEKELDIMPNRIKISTIDSFLYSEFIDPFYNILFDKYYKRINAIDLPQDIIIKNSKIRKLEENNYLHITKISERAKWVICKKTGDKKDTQQFRQMVLNIFCSYCNKIFLDEAQDIDDNTKDILVKLNELKIPIELMGDPKQDIKGNGNFKLLIEERSNKVNYQSECHRCPKSHVVFFNEYLEEAERQDTKKIVGELKYVFESDISDCNIYINKRNFDCKYVSRKNDRFATNRKNDNNLNIIIEILAKAYNVIETKKNISLLYYYAECMVSEYRNTNCIELTINNNLIKKIEKKYYAQLCNALNNWDYDVGVKGCINVNTIDYIKGQEGENCLFILTTDLAEYLFKNKTERNKIFNKLYVALTRSLKDLTILITKEIESKHGRLLVEDFLKNHSIIEDKIDF